MRTPGRQAYAVSLCSVGQAAGNDAPHGASGEGASPAPVELLGQALERYEQNRSPAALDQAFGAAAAAVAGLRGSRAGEPADAVEVRRLMDQLPEFDRLVSIAVHEAERAAHLAAQRLWEWFGLRSAPPAWNQNERSAARVVVASACAPLQGRGAAWLRPRLLRLAADRWAAALAAELRTADEALWRRALGERYESVRQRYAPRTRRRSGTLSQVFSKDERPVTALHTRLSRWLAEGGEFDGLPAEVEAAFVHARTPARLA
jgi:hypothetical protein